MNRRGFLTGLLASVAVPALANGGPYVLRTTIVPGPVYGRSPGMVALYDNSLMHQWIVEAMREMEKNTRTLYSAAPPVAIKTTFENGQCVQRHISAAEFYR